MKTAIDAHGRISKEAAQALKGAAERSWLRRVGLLVGGPRIVCGCGAERNVRVQNCDLCGLDASFAAPLWPKRRKA